MKKLLLLFSLITAMFATVNAGVVITEQYKFLFNGVTTSTTPSSPAITATLYGGTTTSTSMYATGNGACALYASSSVLFSGGGSGNRGSIMYNLNGNTALSTTKKEVLEFDWNPATTQVDAMGHNSLGISDVNKNPVMILVAEGWGGAAGGIHLMNLTPSTTYLNATNYQLVAPAYVTTGNYKADCITNFAGSALGADFVNNKTYHIRAKLDFSTHMIDSITVTRADDATKIYTGTAIAFISAAATNVDKISAFGRRGRKADNTGDLNNSMIWMTVDNYQVYTWEVASTTSVTVNYYDADNTSTLITTAVRNNQAIGGTYTATGVDKTSFTNSGFYYVYSSMLLDNVTIAGDASSHVDVAVKKYPVTTADYTWTGFTDGNWNELNANFTTDAGATNVGYQPTNGVIFPETASNKTITVSDNFNLGTGDLTITGDGYNISGSAVLTGTGKVNVNLTGTQAVILGATSNLTGASQIAGGNVTLSKSGVLGTALTVSGAATLATGANSIAIPATTFNASTTINTGTNNLQSIAGMTADSGVKISISNGYNHPSATTTGFDFATAGTLSAGSELELNGTGTDNRIGMASASATYLANTKLTLKGATMLYINANQTAASTISVGTLAGETGTKLGWGRSSDLARTITWSVGALNENSEFAGQITNTGGYNSGGNSYVGTSTNLEKVGTGTLTLSGTSTHNGTVTVTAGTLDVTGSLGAGAPVTVAAGATLKGTGTILGTLTNHGTLEGSINFNALTLSDTTSLNVTGFNPGEFDHITVVGTVVNGGTLRINIANDPVGTGSIQLFTAGAIDNTAGFTTVKIISPSNPATVAAKRAPSATNAGTTYTYDASTGTLSYAPKSTTSLNTLHADLQVYPSLSRGNVYVNAENVSSISVVALNGQMIKQVNPSGNLTTVNLNGLENGSYILNVKFNDGLNKSQQILLQK